MRPTKADPDTAIRRAVDTIGGPTRAAIIAGVTEGGIYKMLRKGFCSDAMSAWKLSQASGIPLPEIARNPKSPDPEDGEAARGDLGTRTDATSQREIDDEPAPPASAAHLTQRRLYGPPTRKRQFPAYNAPETETDFLKAA